VVQAEEYGQGSQGNCLPCLYVPADAGPRTPRRIHRPGFAGLEFPDFGRFGRMAVVSDYDLEGPNFGRVDGMAASFDQSDWMAAMLDCSIR
jgi:hypothetical protein